MKYDAGFLYVCNGAAWKTVPFMNPVANLMISPMNRFDMDVTMAKNPGDYVTFTVTNNGPVISAKMKTGLGNTTNFEFGTNNCDGMTLAGGASCTIQVRPKATGNGAITGTLHVLANNNPGASLVGVVSGVESKLYEFTTHTFTNCGQTGRTGPTLSQCRSSYSTTWDEIYLTMTTNGIQKWMVPQSGNYTIEIAGSAGGTHGHSGNRSYGAKISAVFTLQRSQILNLLVGQKGEDSLSTQDNAGPGGGGGSFVWDPINTTEPLIAVGGGGGAHFHLLGGEEKGRFVKSGGSTNVDIGTCNLKAAGGIGGSGGNGATDSGTDVNFDGGHGAGWKSDGQNGFPNSNNESGKAPSRPLSGGFGSEHGTDGNDEGGDGGFGGGAGGTDDNGSSGGAGGYSGGSGGAMCSDDRYSAGGGGGSYVNSIGSNRVNITRNHSGHGYIRITKNP